MGMSKKKGVKMEADTDKEGYCIIEPLGWIK